MCTSLFTSVITGAWSERVKDNQTEEGKGNDLLQKPTKKKGTSDAGGRAPRTGWNREASRNS